MLFRKNDFLKLPLTDGNEVMVRKSAIIRVWNDSNHTAIMYTSNKIDHVKMSLKELLEKLK